MAYNPKILQKPKEGEEITIKDNKLHVPDYPIILSLRAMALDRILPQR